MSDLVVLPPYILRTFNHLPRPNQRPSVANTNHKQAPHAQKLNPESKSRFISKCLRTHHRSIPWPAQHYLELTQCLYNLIIFTLDCDNKYCLAGQKQDTRSLLSSHRPDSLDESISNIKSKINSGLASRLQLHLRTYRAPKRALWCNARYKASRNKLRRDEASRRQVRRRQCSKSPQ